LGVFTPPSFDATAAASFSFVGVVDITRRRPSTVDRRRRTSSSL
jgi:hypothetical protein